MSIEHSYVLITAAKNEAKCIEKTINSVISQEILPTRWVIVNDGSSDDTGSIVEKYGKEHEFIHLISKPPSEHRHFSAKANALQEAIEYLKHINLKTKYIGNLDADVSFGSDFYPKLIKKMEDNPELGIVGGLCHEMKENEWVVAHPNPEWSVGGATQFFRADLFLDTGGYPPLEYGGEDTIIEYLARHKGFKVTALNGVVFYHHKPRTIESIKDNSIYFKIGIQEYHWGTTPVFEILKCIARIGMKPFLLGSLLRFCGYVYAMCFKRKFIIPIEYVRIVQKQQNERLLNDFTSKFLKPFRLINGK